jgi:DNA-binding MarR family transcriptional regulator
VTVGKHGNGDHESRQKEAPSAGNETDAARRAWAAMCDLVLDNERRRAVSDAVGLPFGRIRALRRVAASPVPLAMGELAAMLGIDAPNATLVVDELERQGLVERRAHPTDRRVKVVAATLLGSTTARKANEIMSRPPDVLTALSGSQLEALVRILETVRSPMTG